MIVMPLLVFDRWIPPYRQKKAVEPGGGKIPTPAKEAGMGHPLLRWAPSGEKERHTEFGLQARQLSKIPSQKKQIPHGLKPLGDDKNRGLVRHGWSHGLSKQAETRILSKPI